MSYANDMESDKAPSHLFSTTKGPNVLLDTTFTVKILLTVQSEVVGSLDTEVHINPITMTHFQIKGKRYRCPCAREYATQVYRDGMKYDV
jgi:hypothetical protein